MATRRLSWSYTDTATHLALGVPTSASQIRAAWRRGMMRWKDFLDVRLATSAPFDFSVVGADLNRKNAWAIAKVSQRQLVMNTAIQAYGLKWSLLGVEIAAPHESGHLFLTSRHLDELPDYYGDRRFSHVMKGGAGSYLYSPGAFSPPEIGLALSKGFSLNAAPTHPYARTHQANLKRWSQQLTQLKAQIVGTKGAAREAIRNRMAKINEQRAADVALTKRIVLLYPFHKIMFAWQRRQAIVTQRDEADADVVERSYEELVRDALAAASRRGTALSCCFAV